MLRPTTKGTVMPQVSVQEMTPQQRVEAFKHIAEGKAGQYYRLNRCPHYEYRDYQSLAYLALAVAANGYRPSTASDADEVKRFAAFARLAIDRYVLSFWKSEGRQKHQLLNTAVRLDARVDENGDPMDDNLPSSNEDDDPYLVLCHDLNQLSLMAALEQRCTELEYRVVVMRVAGCGYAEIAVALKTKPKSVDNALMRVRRKMADLNPNSTGPFA